MRQIMLTTSCVVLLVLGLLVLVLYPGWAQPLQDPGQPGPYAADYVTITTTNPSTGSELVTDIHFPASGGDVDPSGAPYPTLVFAHGFMAPRSGYVGYGEHLGSWGYIVAIPGFPDDDLEVRASDVQHLLSYLEAENANGDSPFFQMIDSDRFGMAGHSLGGLSTLMIASRDARINMAGVPLDPAGGMMSDWDPETETVSITAPIVVIGAPAQLCNSNGEYNDWYPYIGATHKAKFVITDGTHCDFMNTDDTGLTDACGFLCGEYSPERSAIAERYTTAWFNYYIYLDTDYYTYLYGEEADQDIQAGIITRTVDTAPRDVAAIGGFRAIELSWTLYHHPIISGYNVYRSQESGNYSSTPYAQVGRESFYTDTAAVPGQQYFYVLRSRDSAGNEHQASDEVSAMLQGAPTLLFPPNGIVTTTQAITFVWQAGAGSSPDGYNLKLDGTVITTTGTTSPTILSVGVHTWTVRAYDASGYSDWASPAWTVEVTGTLPPPGIPTLLAPPDGTITTTQAITFAWQASAGAAPTGYNLKLDGMVMTTTGTTSPTILSVGVHTWTVRAYNAVGYSDWVSPAWTVEVIAPPTTPILLLPPNGIVTATQAITFVWQAGAGSSPDGYNLKLDGRVITTTGTTSPTILSVGVHTWTVRAYNAAGYSDWVSPAWTVEVIAPPATPILLFPPNGIVTTTQTITFAWQAGTGPPPEGYNLELDSIVITTTSTTSATILSVGVHTWTVRAYNADGYSDWVTPAWTVEVTDTLPAPGVPTLLAPPDGAITTTQTITFVWQAGAGAAPAGYNVQLDDVVITTTGTTSATILSVGVHTWTVRAYNTVGASEWAAPWTIEVRRYQIYLPVILKSSLSMG